jgi:hypothetical protein
MLSRGKVTDLALELEAIRISLKSAHIYMLSSDSESALGDMIMEELSAIWRSIDALAAAIESNGKSVRFGESP